MFIPAYWLSISLMFLMGSMFLGTVLFNWLVITGILNKVSFSLTRLPELFANQPTLLEFQLHNHLQIQDLKHLKLDLTGNGFKLSSQTVPKIPKGEVYKSALEVSAANRGRARISSMTFTISHPFGLVQATRVSPLNIETIIYPELIESSDGALYSNQETVGITPRSGDDFLYLSTYQVGDDVRRINWKRSANLPLPVVKRDLSQIEQTIPRLFIPDACPGFEHALSIMATHFAAEHHLSGWKILTSTGIVSPQNREEMLQELALAVPLNPSQAEAYETQGLQVLYASQL